MEIEMNTFYWILLASLGLYGISTGVGKAALATLYTNSIRTGDRSEWLSKLQIVQSIGLCFGPLSSVVVLKICGNKWIMKDMLVPWNVSVLFTYISSIVYIYA